jgi:predicted O-methyltransferase YrrM
MNVTIEWKKIWAKTNSIYGEFTRHECYRLYSIAESCGKSANFVEIGCYVGRSSTILGQVAKKNNCDLLCIDTFETPAPDIKDVKERFIQNMKSVDAKFRLQKTYSAKASISYNKKIDLLFIDGDHAYEGVKLDCLLWVPKLKVDGYVLFHDYKSSWGGVKKAVDELVGFKDEGLTDSMRVLKRELNYDTI